MKDTIETVMVNSSAIYSAEYNVEKEELIVYFNNDGIYKYLSVPKFYWRGLFNSSSKGKFINSFISRKFTYNKIN